MALVPLIAGGRVFVALEGGAQSSQVVALDRGTGKTLWSRPSPQRLLLAFGRGRLFGVASGGRVSAFDPASGNVLWERALPGSSPRYENPPIVTGELLRAYASVFQPPPNGSEEFVARDYVRYADTGVTMFGAVGRDLRGGGPQRVTLESDPFPSGSFAKAGETTSRAAGTFEFRIKPTRNTRYHTRAEDGPASRGGTVYVFPRFVDRLRRGSGRRVNDITSTVRMTGPPEVGLGGRRVHLYLVRVKRKQVAHVAGGALRGTARGRAAATLRFRAFTGFRSKDYLFYGVRGLSRVGLAPPDVVDRRCARSRLPH